MEAIAGNTLDERELRARAAAVEHGLRAAVSGDVRFDESSLALWALDASKYRQVPLGVVLPRTTDDLVAAVAVCREHDVPIVMRGSGTSLSGQGCNIAVVIDTTRYLNRVLELDPKRRIARVQPGVVLDELRAAAAPHGLTFGPDPSTHAWCTMGGMIGNNSCGRSSVAWGRTSDNVESLEIVTYDGQRLRVGPTGPDELDQIIRGGGRRGQIYADMRDLRDKYAGLIRGKFPQIPRRVSGYNLDELLPERGFHVGRALAGTEGTCAILLEATVRLVPNAPHRVLVVVGFDDIGIAGDHVAQIRAHGPLALEGTDGALVELVRRRGIETDGLKHLPPRDGLLFVEFGGDTPAEAVARAAEMMQDLDGSPFRPAIRLIEDTAVAKSIWLAREAALGATARLPDGRDTWEGWEDPAVPVARLGDYLRDYQALLRRHGRFGTIYGHFGDGLVHSRIDFDMTTAAGVAEYRRFCEEAADIVVGYGGSLTGEHGDGQSRAELLPKMFGPELIRAFEEFKAIWDPADRMNPGKVVRPRKLDDDLRIGAGYELPQLDTQFTYPDDQHNFGRAVGRCVGVGKCRKQTGGIMCPSFRVTQDEKHSTRGRAHLLFDMAHSGAPEGELWKDERVKEALDLCLACKGCKRDCPARVDMATYKAEFLSHYYQHHRRPIQAYAFGWIHRWARLGSIAPRVANFMSHAPGVGTLMKKLGGVALQRRVPKLAGRTFRQSFTSQPSDGGRKQVILWADTFNNHFTPEIALAAVKVLEAAGFSVILPPQGLCCGRPLYDFGMLDQARRQLQEIITAMEPHLSRGVPIVGLEPGCLSVFRDEAVNLVGPSAARLRDQSFTLAEFLRDHAPDFRPQLNQKILFHAHCHQQALMGAATDVGLLRRLGAEVTAPDTGCCGMAGSFGFAAENYDVSQQIGELALLPAVRATPTDTLIVTDGFSCREQIEQATGRRVLHLAQALALAIDGDARHNIDSAATQPAATPLQEQMQ